MHPGLKAGRSPGTPDVFGMFFLGCKPGCPVDVP